MTKKIILLGITGGIAAYKSADIASKLVRQDFLVDVVMTDAATRFITPLTLKTITHRNVHVSQWADYEPKPDHISLASRCDIAVIAPATANTIAKIAHGIADNLLTSTLLALKAPLLVAPAMNSFMWKNPITQQNIQVLRDRNIEIIEPATGRLACGTEGTGRMADTDEILAVIQRKILSNHE